MVYVKVTYRSYFQEVGRAQKACSALQRISWCSAELPLARCLWGEGTLEAGAPERVYQARPVHGELHVPGTIKPSDFSSQGKVFLVVRLDFEREPGNLGLLLKNGNRWLYFVKHLSMLLNKGYLQVLPEF